MTPLQKARRVFDIEIAALRAVRAQIDAQFARAAELLVETLDQRGKIIVIGVGKSGNIGTKVAATLTSTGSPSVLLSPSDALHGDLGVINDGDAILALSYSGETEELLRILPALKRFKVRIRIHEIKTQHGIAITAETRSTLARHADVVLRSKVPKEACPFNLAPTSSTTAMLVMGDALAMTILEMRGFKEKDFARFHPGGSIGRTLLDKATAIMRSGKKIAIVRAGVNVKTALAAMIRAKCGSVCVVDGKGKLRGVFTDGDLRRHFAEEDLMARRIDDVMTPDPIRIKETALAAEALKIFDEHAIDDLVVVDKLNRPVGLIDSQDLPKLKVL